MAPKKWTIRADQEHFTAIVPLGFGQALRRLVGQEMAASGMRVTLGTFLAKLIHEATKKKA